MHNNAEIDIIWEKKEQRGQALAAANFPRLSVTSPASRSRPMRTCVVLGGDLV